MKYFILILLTGLIGLGSCSTLREVSVQKEKGIDFSGYKSYAWLPDKEFGKETLYTNDFIRQKTKNYFGHCMSQRAITLDTLNPDLLLRVDWLSHQREMEMTWPGDVPDYYDITYYNAPTLLLYSGGFQRIPGQQVYYPEGEVIKLEHGGAKLTVIDRAKNAIIWTGTIQGDLYDPAILYRDLHPGVHKLMKRFPIKVNE